ncbi:MAG TPA: hypothetical protein VFQ58_07010, partial [Flavisolibacter sp.]|nr:hypothetical protein [Flavisolibacter sp.]
MRLTFLLLMLFSLAGCLRQNYFLSPFQANTPTYHSMPQLSEQAHTANYISGNFAKGGANRGDDPVFDFKGEFYRAHSFGIFEAYYGAEVTFGNYTVSKQRPPTHSARDSFITNVLNKGIGNKFFGGYGLNGGISMVVPANYGRGEWRAIGIETSLTNEFGQYLLFRKQLPDSIATANMNYSFFPTIGITSEFISNGNKGSIGYKIAAGWCLRKENAHYNPVIISVVPPASAGY